MRSIEQASYWLANRPPTPATPLTGNLTADVAIVGAGFTGLWTAHFLRQLDPNTEVVVIEQGVAGYGGSGRNAGIVSPCLDHSPELAARHFGPAEADRLTQIGRQNIAELAHFATDCDFEHTGQLHVALKPTPGLTLSAAEIRRELNSPLYCGGTFDPHAAIINPVKLVDKLRQGLTLHDRTPVTAITDGAVHTPHGKITARQVVLATNAFSHHLFPQLLRHFIPLYDYILVSAPLTTAQRAAIGWQNRQGVTDNRTFFNYYRLTTDNRILWGTSEAQYYRGNRVDETCDHSDRHYAELKQSFVRHFPQIAELKWEYAWGGPIASTTRLTPFFGSRQRGKLIYALGYTGHGIGTTRVAGKILAHMALAKPSELLQLAMVQRLPLPYPPEPLRSWAVNVVTRSLRRMDTGAPPNALVRTLDLLGIGFSS